MSAYGAISRPTPTSSTPLNPRSFLLPTPTSSSTTPPSPSALTVFPLTRATADKEMITYLTSVFNDVIEEGRTYPQFERMSDDDFSGYFFSHDCFVGLLEPASPSLLNSLKSAPQETGIERDPTNCILEEIRAGRSWKECTLGMFYVKPNYPGRSSHNCNGGFVVPTVHRGLKVGINLGRAYLYYAPSLGYRASVFNLVYVTNIPSLKIWDALGFKRAGLVPEAGRLKSLKEGGEDEFVDAVVYYKRF